MISTNHLILIFALCVFASPHFAAEPTDSHSCQRYWTLFGDSCHLITNRSTIKDYLSSKFVCYTLGSTLVDVRICDGSQLHCSRVQFDIERHLLDNLQINDSVYIGAKLIPSVSRDIYYFDVEPLRSSLRSWSMKHRLVNTTEYMVASNQSSNNSIVEVMCLTVAKVSHMMLRYQPVACDSKHQFMCKFVLFNLSAQFIVCYALWFCMLIASSWFIFMTHRTNILKSEICYSDCPS